MPAITEAATRPCLFGRRMAFLLLYRMPSECCESPALFRQGCPLTPTAKVRPRLHRLARRFARVGALGRALSPVRGSQAQPLIGRALGQRRRFRQDELVVTLRPA